jgi:cytochrome c5
MRFERLCVALIAGTAVTMLASPTAAQQAPIAPTVAHTPPSRAPAAQPAHEKSDGERVFEANCSRCHTAPDGFSQGISGTVVLHMRVRASLSARDEQALLRFFNP